jgi:uncharacterized protein (TIGR02145 family)
MQQSLNYGIYKESIFTNDPHSDVTNNGVVEKYALDNDENNYLLYGGLYDWDEMMNYMSVEGGKGICPDGWHIPSLEEFDELIDAVGGTQSAGAALVVGGSSGFDYVIGGSRTAKGAFSTIGTGGIWTSTVSLSHPDSRAYNFYFTEGANNIGRATDVMFVGKSCRCLKD